MANVVFDESNGSAPMWVEVDGERFDAKYSKGSRYEGGCNGCHFDVNKKHCGFGGNGRCSLDREQGIIWVKAQPQSTTDVVSTFIVVDFDSREIGSFVTLDEVNNFLTDAIADGRQISSFGVSVNGKQKTLSLKVQIDD